MTLSMIKAATVVAVGAVAAILLMSADPVSGQDGKPGAPPANNVNDWLLNAPDDAARFRLLQTYLRGFEQPMWEVGERYDSMYRALGDKNWELAEYHWSKIKVTIVTGYLKRPKRQANADDKFVKKIWDDVNTAFLSKDPQKAWSAFELTRQACMSCHEAEKVAFMNNQPLFRRTEKAPAGLLTK